jgi:small acid-soluble spore protein D (minor alpha/beta-type SASP)
MSRNRPLVPESKQGLAQLRVEVANEIGLPVSGEAESQAKPDAVTRAAAAEYGVPLQNEYNGGLTSHDAGRLGGHVGGKMVKRLIAQAESLLAQSDGGAAGPAGRSTTGLTAGNPPDELTGPGR